MTRKFNQTTNFDKDYGKPKKKIIEGLTLIGCSVFFTLVLFGLLGKSGDVIKKFIIGIFGYTIYPAIVFSFSASFFMIFGRKINLKNKTAIFLIGISIFIIIMSHILLTYDLGSLGYNLYLKETFLKANTFGGAIGSLFLYPLTKINFSLLQIFMWCVFLALLICFFMFGINYKKTDKTKENLNSFFKSNNKKKSSASLISSPIEADTLQNDKENGDNLTNKNVNINLSSFKNLNIADFETDSKQSKRFRKSKDASSQSTDFQFLNEKYGAVPKKNTEIDLIEIQKNEINNAILLTIKQRKDNEILLNKNQSISEEKDSHLENLDKNSSDDSNSTLNSSTYKIDSETMNKKIHEMYTNKSMQSRFNDKGILNAHSGKHNIENNSNESASFISQNETYDETIYKNNAFNNSIMSKNISDAKKKDGLFIDNQFRNNNDRHNKAISDASNLVNNFNIANNNTSETKNSDLKPKETYSYNKQTLVNENENNFSIIRNTDNEDEDNSLNYTQFDKNNLDNQLNSESKIEKNHYDAVTENFINASAETNNNKSFIDKKPNFNKFENKSLGNDLNSYKQNVNYNNEENNNFNYNTNKNNVEYKDSSFNSDDKNLNNANIDLASSNTSNNTGNNLLNDIYKSNDDSYDNNQSNIDQQSNLSEGKIDHRKYLSTTGIKYYEDNFQMYQAPFKNLLNKYEQAAEFEDYTDSVLSLENTLDSLGIKATVSNVVVGASFHRFELVMPKGVSVSKVKSIGDDISMILEAKTPVRLVIPIIGKNAFGIEVGNDVRSTVGLMDLINSQNFFKNKHHVSVPIGKDLENRVIVEDMNKMPHLLVAGSSGQGKSVFLNALICSLMFRYSPREVRFLLFDPKNVEFGDYANIPHLLTPKPILDMEHIVRGAEWLSIEMERRYKHMSYVGGVRDILQYNDLFPENDPQRLPFIVAIIDEIADIMSNKNADFNIAIAKLSSKARASGIILVLATQRPDATILNGAIKTNFPARISFKVSNFTDSKIVIDTPGAEKLLGSGDMLFKSTASPNIMRLQGAYISSKEINAVCKFVKENNNAIFDPILNEFIFYDKNEENNMKNIQSSSAVQTDLSQLSADDERIFYNYFSAATKSGKSSCSHLQISAQIGFPRALKIYEAAKARHVLVSSGSKFELAITNEEFENTYKK